MKTIYVGFRVWLAHWILRGLGQEFDRLRTEVSGLEAQVKELRVKLAVDRVKHHATMDG
jgi:hypothetical protein